MWDNTEENIFKLLFMFQSFSTASSSHPLQLLSSPSNRICRGSFEFGSCEFDQALAELLTISGGAQILSIQARLSCTWGVHCFIIYFSYAKKTIWKCNDST